MLPICFIHIPKTAGSSLLRILSFNALPQYTAAIYPANINDGAKLLKRIEENVNELMIIEPTLFMGHIGFGLLDAIGRKATYITMMRNPIDRCISEYQFAKNNQFHYMHRKIHENKMSIVDYFKHRANDGITNIQSRMLAANEGVVDWGMTHSELLDSASENLNRITLLGIQERFSDFLIMLSDSYPHFFIWNEKLNEGNKSTLDSFQSHEMEDVEEFYETDVLLYKIALKRFEEKFSQIVNSEHIRNIIHRTSLSMESSKALTEQMGLPGVQLALHGPGGSIIKTQTDGNGLYYVNDLKNGDYDTKFSNGAVGRISHAGGNWELKITFTRPSTENNQNGGESA